MTTITTSVLSIESLSPNVLKIMLDAKQPVSFKAGQYLQVVMSEKDKRPFSIANAPNNDHLLELHIGATPSNAYAFEVIELAKSAKALTAEVGLGQAFLRDSDMPAIIVAGGTGYSYAKSILFDCLHQQPNRTVYLYWGAKTPDDLYELDSLRQLTSTHKHFNFIPVIESSMPQWTGKTGLVHEAVMSDFPSLINTQVYVAGRFEMAAVVKTAFLPLGLTADNLFGDAFAFLK
ncbi:MAG: aquacobalamin reductase/NAD(P)H-flavin reductase [Glaciecola sp.]|jgi:aquacobalamin reductase/NAD(P)H-flavin reductase